MKRYHLGRKISFVCVARGTPRPNITWMKDGLELNAYSGYEHVIMSLIWQLKDHYRITILTADQRMATGEESVEVQDGDRPGHAEGRGLLRVPERQQILH